MCQCRRAACEGRPVADYPGAVPDAWAQRLTHSPPVVRTWATAVLALAETVEGKSPSWRFDIEPASTTTDDYLTMLDDRLVVAREAESDEQLLGWLDAEPDRLFREITVEATELMFAVSGGSIEPSDEWWFHRAPRAGYVRDGLLEVAEGEAATGEQ